VKIIGRFGYLIPTMAAVAFLPQTAHAHLMSSGMGPFYDGVQHLVVSADDFLGVIALALLAGQYGKDYGRNLLFLLPAAWIVGGFAGLMHARETLAPIASALSLLAAGALLALSARLNVLQFSGAAMLFGLFHGYLNGTSIGSGSTGVIGLTGITLSVFVVVALLSAFSVSLRAPWTKIAVRVAGSWIAAIGLLMVGWAMRSTGA